MPPFHTVSGRNITIYLDVRNDPMDTTASGNPFERLLKKVAAPWNTIATAHNLKLTFAPVDPTPLLDPTAAPPTGTAPASNASPTDRILYGTALVTPPAGVEAFQLLVGNGASADPKSQSTQTSYVKYEAKAGYLYVIGNELPDIPHELGHILGLVDRYYEAVCWNKQRVIRRTCAQIRAGQWFDSQGVDQRISIPATSNLPYDADRVSLIMSKKAVPEDGDYLPDDNLMSNSSPKLTPCQLEYIGIKPDGQNMPPVPEPEIRKNNWVGILGDKNANDFSTYYVWEETDRKNRGLKYYPGNMEKDSNGNDVEPESYACFSKGKGRGREDGEIVKEELITEVMGKKDTWLSVFKNLATPDLRRYKRVKKSGTTQNNRHCYTTRVLTDLE